MVPLHHWLSFHFDARVLRVDWLTQVDLAQTIIHISFCNKIQSKLIILNDNILNFIIVARGTLKFD